MMSTDRDLQLLRKQERAQFFSSKEQDLVLKLYEEEREILTSKSNTTSASKLREEAWQRIADKINAVSDSGYKRTWQQVKIKHKNITQTAKRKKVEVSRTDGGSATPSLTSAEDDVIHGRENTLKMEVLPGGIGPMTGSDSSLMSGKTYSAVLRFEFTEDDLTAVPDVKVSGHPVLLLPVMKTEPESLSGDETDISDTHYEGEVQNCSFQEAGSSAEVTAGVRGGEKQTDDLKALYCAYLKKEIENRDQEMAYRALKMRKLEKEIQLLDKQLM
uniref:Myb/SANT-like DNA-binding domain-containing protein n=1 Tax=Nothobranchius kuhntae TaxID=321403 RepID=A0A1A8JEY9_NOTKU